MVVPYPNYPSVFLQFGVAWRRLCHLKTLINIFRVHGAEMLWMINIGNVAKPNEQVWSLSSYNLKDIAFVLKYSIA